MSARNRELLALIPVAALVTAGFTAVFIVESNQIGDLSLIYGGYFLAICLAVHLFIRVRLPYADPYLFPLCALLAAIGTIGDRGLVPRLRPYLTDFDPAIARQAADLIGRWTGTPVEPSPRPRPRPKIAPGTSL